MTKYIDADLLRKEIEKNKNMIDGLFTEGDDSVYDGEDDAYNRVLRIIDTLSEEPDKSLEEAAEEYTQKMLESWKFDSTGCRPLREPFIAEAEWQKSQMLKDAVEADAEVCKLTERVWITPIDGKKFHQDVYDNFKAGDKVRIVVLKEEEK